MLSHLSQAIEPFHVMEIVKVADRLSQMGKDVIHLSIGEPDFPVPEPVSAAMCEALSQSRTRYTAALGLESLREKIANFYNQRWNAAISSEQIVITSGASTALMYGCLALINPGDEVLLCDPGYPCNKTFVAAAGGKARFIEVSEASNFQPTLKDIQNSWTENTKGILLASPANPTGTRLEQSVLEQIVGWVNGEGGFVIMDEIYQLLCYGSAPRSLAEIAQAVTADKPNIIVNSFSKYFGMTGLRLGWMVIPGNLAHGIEKLAQNLNICPSTPAQWAALACFEPETLAICESRRQQFEIRQQFLMRNLPAAGIEPHSRPDGAFYIYARSPAPSSDYCLSLLENAHVCTVPGKDFSMRSGEEMFRISYANSLERIEEALERIRKFNS